MYTDPLFFLYLCLAAIGGGLFATLLMLRVSAKRIEQETALAISQLQTQLHLLESQLTQSKAQAESHMQEVHRLREHQLHDQKQLGEFQQQAEQMQRVGQQKEHIQQQYQHAVEQLAQLRTQLDAQADMHAQQQATLQEKVALLESAEQRLQTQFENLANKIFEQKQERFQQSSQTRLDALLTPLKEQIEGFKKQVTDQYVKEGQERASLKTEILGLKELNQQITHEAAALTRALKGDNKQQGNWGEVVLERILKESGLREGHEFETQVALRDAQGKQYQPDVVVHLPNEKDIVIDAKMSLAAYERYYNEQEDEALRQTCLQEHVTSLKTHIRELGKKDYQDLKGLRTLDYVLMFVPVESAFLLAVDQAPELVKQALDNNIMLVSPTNLLVALRTINNIWQYEYQNQNAQVIADKAAKLYGKFHGFISDMDKMGKSLESAQKTFDGAMNKLTTGKGNLVRQVEQFRDLGVQTNKKLDDKLIEQANDPDEDD